MKFPSRNKSAAAVPDEDAAAPSVLTGGAVTGGKGRPTPKRRESEPQRGPVSAPKTRKEAYARRREMDKAVRNASRSSGRSSGTTMTPAERRAAFKAGDPAALPRRDQGPARALARDYVDSRLMLSNFMLLLFPLLVLSYVVPLGEYILLPVFLAMLVEWFIAGRRVTALAVSRGITPEVGAMVMGFYCGNRAFMPRRWRLPAARLRRGDKV